MDMNALLTAAAISTAVASIYLFQAVVLLGRDKTFGRSFAVFH